MRFLYTVFLAIGLVCNPTLGWSQEHSLKASYIEQIVTIDGQLNEPFWDNLSVANDFWQYFPSDS